MKKHLTSFDLKVIAIVTMTIDHIGFYLYPEIEFLRIIGRIAFPIFAFLTAQSFRYTHNRNTYFIRMLLLGTLFTAVKFYFEPHSGANIFLTLGLGFGILYGLEEKQYLMAIVPLVLGILIDVDYGFYGLLLVPLMYYFENKLLYVVPIMGVMTWYAKKYLYFSPLQYYAIISIIILLLYNRQPGYKKAKYFFYIYYPVHIIVLNLLVYWRNML